MKITYRKKNDRDNGPLYFIAGMLLGLALIYGPEKHWFKAPFPYNQQVGTGIFLVGGLMLLSWMFQRGKKVKVCSVCGWTGPPKRWEEMGGCPICIAKKKQKSVAIEPPTRTSHSHRSNIPR